MCDVCKMNGSCQWCVSAGAQFSGRCPHCHPSDDKHDLSPIPELRGASDEQLINELASRHRSMVIAYNGQSLSVEQVTRHLIGGFPQDYDKLLKVLTLQIKLEEALQDAK